MGSNDKLIDDIHVTIIYNYVIILLSTSYYPINISILY